MFRGRSGARGGVHPAMRRRKKETGRGRGGAGRAAGPDGAAETARASGAAAQRGCGAPESRNSSDTSVATPAAKKAQATRNDKRRSHQVT